MKVNDKKNIKLLGLFLLSMLILDTALIALLWLINQKPNQLIVFLLIVFIVITYNLSKLQYTEFENSGLVITIKKKKLFTGNAFGKPLLELPVQLIQKCELKSQVLHIYCQTFKSKEKQLNFKVNVIAFTRKQKGFILQNLSVDNDDNCHMIYSDNTVN